MSLSAAVLRELMAAGLSGDALLAACERIEAAAPEVVIKPVRTARQERNARYYDRFGRSRPRGKSWRALKEIVLRRDEFRCRYCGESGVPLHCDHVVPFSKGGSSTADNLVASCGPCNSAKGNRI